MLKNYSENVILPAYNMLQDSVDQLNSSATTFSNTPNTQNLEVLQQSLKGARLAWQNASLFEFGPAEMQLLRTSLNTYPTDTTKINDNINSGNYSLGSLDNQDAVGFPAVGFLVYGDNKTDSEIVSQFTNETNAQNRMDYLLDNIAFIKENVDAVVTKWKADGDNYASTFLSEENSGTDIGSSMGMLINAMVLHYERFLRDGKIGIPSGVRSAGIPRPSTTEALYGGYSVELAIENMQAFKRLYLGIDLNSNDGLGLQENLDAVGTATLADEIETNIDQSLDKLNALNDPLSQQVDSNNDPVVEAFQAMQKVVTLVKADMTSALGITITYQDNDGD
ncbi:imelysin family protein [Fodinibius halophilus]|uniref:Imelysin family protein n=1 Tax=Fodinibius halophilus TaxID=1736908 RepID=A0A6M1TLD4_9BACT|nr:imelysin family protein [Fodinibius halophilus]NGP89260.1 imelysin family protein [Fodinibius halophilus]